MAKILVPLADGFEEIEAITIIDVLRRAGIEVIVAGLKPGPATGAHTISVACDTVVGPELAHGIDGIALPGGMPGTTALLKNSAVREIIVALDRENKLLAAICAAPTVLYAAGVLKGKNAACYPGKEKEMPGVVYSPDTHVCDGNIITGKGPGAAIEFALAIVRYISGPAAAASLRKALAA